MSWRIGEKCGLLLNKSFDLILNYNLFSEVSVESTLI